MKFKFHPAAGAYLNVMQDPDPDAAGGSAGGGGGNSTDTNGSESSSGGDDTTDTAGLKSALEKERSARKDLETSLKQMRETLKDVDPNKYQELLNSEKQYQQERERWNQKEVQIKSEAEREWRPQVEQAQATAKQFEQKYNDLLLRTHAEAAYQAAHGRTGGGDDGVTFFNSFFNNVRNQLKLATEGDGVSVEVVDQSGTRLFSKDDASKPITPSEFFKQLHKHPVLGFYFEAPKAKGGGYQGNNRQVGGGVDPSKLSPEQKMEMSFNS